MISPALPDSVEYRRVAKDDGDTGEQEPENEQELLWGGPILPENMFVRTQIFKKIDMFCFSLNCFILFSFTDVFEAKYVLLWTYLRIVQEKVALSSPRVPHTSIRGGKIIPKEKAHTVKIISRMFSRE